MMELNTCSLESRGQILENSPQQARLWKPAAQRNVRNQWSKLASLSADWRTASVVGRCHATAVVNSYLSNKYIDGMDFGVLSGLPNIQTKARHKLFKQQELYKGKLLSSYREMVVVVTQMVNACKNMRCYFRGTSSSLSQFSFSSNDDGDSGDCGGIPVFTFLSIAAIEELAWEIVQMFISELNLKRLLVMELLSLYDTKVAESTAVHWSDDFYGGEFDDLNTCCLYSEETHAPILPSLKSFKSNASTIQYKQKRDNNVLQVYITTWLAELNIDSCRVEEIFSAVGGELRVNFLGTSD